MYKKLFLYTSLNLVLETLKSIYGYRVTNLTKTLKKKMQFNLYLNTPSLPLCIILATPLIIREYGRVRYSFGNRMKKVIRIYRVIIFHVLQ